MIMFRYQFDSSHFSFLSYPLQNAAINAWAKSRRFGKAYRAKSVLQKMVSMYEAGEIRAKPNVFMYTGVLNACAYSVGDAAEKRDAIAIAANTFKELCTSNYGPPNHVTYATYITACKHLLPEGSARATSVGTVFKKCCQDGMVNDVVISRVKGALSSEQFREVLGNEPEGRIPPEWSRNIKPQRGRHQRPNRR